MNKTKHNQVFAGIWAAPSAEYQNISTLWDRQIIRYYVLIERHSNLLGSCITCMQHKYMIDESYLIIASNYHNYVPCRLQLPAWGNICQLVWPIFFKIDFFSSFPSFFFVFHRKMSFYLSLFLWVYLISLSIQVHTAVVEEHLRGMSVPMHEKGN